MKRLKRFIEKLKEDGLYDNSVIVLYGDHYGISENHNEAMSQFLGREVTPFEEVQLQRVPLVIHIPGVTDKEPKAIDTVGGQIDIRPTVLNLLGIDSSDQIQFGNDLFAKDKRSLQCFATAALLRKTKYTQTAYAMINRQESRLKIKRL